jgi:ribosomal protein S18 acetylase RimI-like enzyme
MCVNFNPIMTPSQITALAAMADQIWHEYFPAILSDAQIDYMVRTFQSTDAIAEQIAHRGYRYFLMEKDGKNIGYTAVREDPGRLFISKIYLVKEARGCGYASEAFRFFENLCREKNLGSMWLTVNRNNAIAIRTYQKKGFAIVRTQVTDIGSGYVMDDYVMEKCLNTETE